MQMANEPKLAGLMAFVVRHAGGQSRIRDMVVSRPVGGLCRIAAWAPLLLAVAGLFAACGDTVKDAAPPAGVPAADSASEREAPKTPLAPSPHATETPRVENPPATVEHQPTRVPGPTPTPMPLRPEALVWVDAFGDHKFRAPVRLLHWPPGGVAVVQKGGAVMGYEGGVATVLLDHTDAVFDKHESGMLDMALDPGWPEHPHAYVWYTSLLPSDDPDNTSQVKVLSRFSLGEDGAFDPESELVILYMPKPQNSAGHHGGTILFGPDDGMLYLSVGDEEYIPNGQDRSNLWGTIIRIDVRDATPDRAYLVPPDNPFVGEDGVRPEIWAYGLRNPWRMSWSSVPGMLWVGDVGAKFEELNLIGAGDNGGWSIRDGTECRSQQSCPPVDFVEPVYAYHWGGQAIIAGPEYDGSAIPPLRGSVLFADYITRQVWARTPDGEVLELASPGDSVLSFSTDAAGEVYALTGGGKVYRLVLKPAR